MRLIRLLYIAVGILLAVHLSSCSKEHQLRKATEKLTGTWTFDEVKRNQRGFRHSVIHRWKMIRLTFHENGSLDWYNQETGITDKGTWHLSIEREAEDSYTYLDITIEDTAHHITQYFWEISSMTRTRMRISEYREEGNNSRLYHLYYLKKD